MAIRIRKIKGHTIAICAAQSKAKKGDIYLDDNAHHALSTKFGLDFKSMGFMNNSTADERLIPLMKREEIIENKLKTPLIEWIKNVPRISIRLKHVLNYIAYKDDGDGYGYKYLEDVIVLGRDLLKFRNLGIKTYKEFMDLTKFKIRNEYNEKS